MHLWVVSFLCLDALQIALIHVIRMTQYLLYRGLAFIDGPVTSLHLQMLRLGKAGFLLSAVISG